MTDAIRKCDEENLVEIAIGRNAYRQRWLDGFFEHELPSRGDNTVHLELAAWPWIVN